MVALPVAFAGSAADPGVSSTSIVLGGTSPLTGPAASYASVARGAKAYFDSINAQGGVAKRKIDYRIVDDAYNPALTVQGVRRLVEQDKVFAVFNTLGTESNLAIRDYLNQSKVPHLFAASVRRHGDATRPSTRGRSASSRATRRRASSTGGTWPAIARRRRSQCSSRTTTTGKTCSAA